MTVVVGYADRETGRVLMASDHASLLGDNITFIPGKVLRLTPTSDSDPVLLGIAGNGGLKYVLAHTLRIPPVPMDVSDQDLDAWAFAVAAEVAQVAITANPPLRTEDGHADGMALLGARGRLWQLAQQCADPVGEFDAIGSGGDFAHGYLAGALANGASPLAAVMESVRHACRYTTSCSLEPGRSAAIEALS